MINDKADVIDEKHFELLLDRYQNKLEKLMKGSEFFFNYVHILYYKCDKINPNHGGSYIDSPNCIKNKKTTITPINKKIMNAFNML